MLLLSPPPLGQPAQDSEKRLYVCLRLDRWEACGWGWPTGQAAGKALTPGAADREKLGQSHTLGGGGCPRPLRRKTRELHRCPATPPPQSGHSIAVVSDMPFCTASVPWEQQAGKVGIPVTGSPELLSVSVLGSIRRGCLWKRAHLASGRDALTTAERKKSKKKCPKGS